MSLAVSNKKIIAIDVDRVLGPYVSAVFMSVKPYNGAIDGVTKLRQKYDLQIITARHPFFRRATIRWIRKYFPDDFTAIDFVHYKTPFGPRNRKSAICKRIGAEIILDDKMSNAIDCSDSGIKVYLFGNHNIHRRNHLPDGVTWVKDWSDVVNELI
jgi:5'(3')-deoxyribonucleotidase